MGTWIIPCEVQGIQSAFQVENHDAETFLRGEKQATAVEGRRGRAPSFGIPPFLCLLRNCILLLPVSIHSNLAHLPAMAPKCVPTSLPRALNHFYSLDRSRSNLSLPLFLPPGSSAPRFPLPFLTATTSLQNELATHPHHPPLLLLLLLE